MVLLAVAAFLLVGCSAPATGVINEAGVSFESVPAEVLAMEALQEGQELMATVAGVQSVAEAVMLEAQSTLNAAVVVRTDEAHALNVQATATHGALIVGQTQEAQVAAGATLVVAQATEAVRFTEEAQVAAFAQATLDVRASEAARARSVLATQEAFAMEQGRIQAVYEAEQRRLWRKVWSWTAFVAVLLVGWLMGRFVLWRARKRTEIQLEQMRLVSLPRNGVYLNEENYELPVRIDEKQLPPPQNADGRRSVKRTLEEADAAQTIRVNNRKGEGYDILKADAHQEMLKRCRDLTLTLLVESINQSGEAAVQIPTAEVLKWGDGRRTKALKMLKPAVVTQAGRSGGSFVNDQVAPNLGALVEAVQEGFVVPTDAGAEIAFEGWGS